VLLPYADRIAHGLPDDFPYFAIMTRYQSLRRAALLRAVAEPPWKKFVIAGLMLFHVLSHHLICALKGISC
jgi:hypothetical protein